MKNRKFLSLIALAMVITLAFTGCANGKTSEFDSENDITVVARDAASGTRGAFHEIMGIIQKQGDTQVDNLVEGALEFDGTDKVITTVEGDKYGIGYISLGSVSDRTKLAKVDGVEATIDNVKSGKYTVARPFLLVTKGEESELVKDFLSFAESKQGQEITARMKYIGAAEEPKDYTAKGISGTIKVAGSTSVTPLMEKIQEAYKELNPEVTFEMQSNGSSQGIKAAIDGSYDIGMSSRELKEEEAGELNRYILAIDGIAVIINNENPTDSLTSQQITSIYTGEITQWSEIK
ncbi:MAG: substrate-binding domain-containing protein [Sedimentibacter sp.]